jgi:hypothetical protein
MDEGKFRGRLEQLHAELGLVDTPDEEEAALLRQLAGDIRAVLGRGDDQQGQYDGLVESLREAVARFETSHASAALLMRQVIDELAYMGI